MATIQYTMPNSSISSGSKRGNTGGKKKPVTFDGILKQIKTGPIKSLKTSNTNLAYNIKKKIKTFNKRIQETVAYGKEIFGKAFKAINEKIGTDKTLLLSNKSPPGEHTDNTASITAPKLQNRTQTEDVESEINFNTNQTSMNSNSGDEDINHQSPGIHVKSTPMEGHIKKKTISLINSLKTISIITEKKDVPPPQGQKLVGIVS